MTFGSEIIYNNIQNKVITNTFCVIFRKRVKKLSVEKLFVVNKIESRKMCILCACMFFNIKREKNVRYQQFSNVKERTCFVCYLYRIFSMNAKHKHKPKTHHDATYSMTSSNQENTK